MKTMARVWTLVGLVAAATILVFLIFILESAIHAKVEELKHRKVMKELNKELDKCISNLSLSNDDIINLLDELDEEDNNE